MTTTKITISGGSITNLKQANIPVPYYRFIKVQHEFPKKIKLLGNVPQTKDNAPDNQFFSNPLWAGLTPSFNVFIVKEKWNLPYKNFYGIYLPTLGSEFSSVGGGYPGSTTFESSTDNFDPNAFYTVQLLYGPEILIVGNTGNTGSYIVNNFTTGTEFFLTDSYNGGLTNAKYYFLNTKEDKIPHLKEYTHPIPEEWIQFKLNEGLGNTVIEINGKTSKGEIQDDPGITPDVWNNSNIVKVSSTGNNYITFIGDPLIESIFDINSFVNDQDVLMIAYNIRMTDDIGGSGGTDQTFWCWGSLREAPPADNRKNGVYNYLSSVAGEEGKLRIWAEAFKFDRTPSTKYTGRLESSTSIISANTEHSVIMFLYHDWAVGIQSKMYVDGKSYNINQSYRGAFENTLKNITPIANEDMKNYGLTLLARAQGNNVVGVTYGEKMLPNVKMSNFIAARWSKANAPKLTPDFQYYANYLNTFQYDVPW